MAKSKQSADLSVPPDSDEPAPWGIELSFINEQEKSLFCAAKKLILDQNKVLIVLSSGDTVTYRFDDVRKVLSMHSKKYDLAQVET